MNYHKREYTTMPKEERLTIVEQAELARKSKTGDRDAQNRIINYCKPAIERAARKLLEIMREETSLQPETDLGDLISVGLLAFNSTLKSYNPDYINSRDKRPGAPITYAYRHIKDGMITEIKRIQAYMQNRAACEQEPLLAENENAYNLDFVIDDIARREQLEHALGSLNPRHREIITQRFGLLDGEPRTLKDIATVHGISRQRVEQIELAAIENLKRFIRMHAMQDFV